MNVTVERFDMLVIKKPFSNTHVIRDLKDTFWKKKEKTKTP